jgi:DNA polymerase
VPILHRDFETRSTLDLEEVGAWRYAADPTTDVWCVAYAVDNGPVKLWLPGQPIPEEFQVAARDPDWLVAAHNDQFETAIEQRILAPRYGWPLVPIERHRCTMATGLANALPGRLKLIAEVLELSARKDDEGGKLMLQMARPRKPRAGEDPNGIYWHDEPEKVERLGAYCKRDVDVERELHHRLTPLTASEQALWVFDQQINQRGFHVDLPLLEAASRIAAEANRKVQDELVSITGGALTSTNQTKAMQDWLGEHGCEVSGVGKAVLNHALRRKGLDPVVRRVMELRISAAHAAAAKVDTLLSWRDADGRVRGSLRFCGAGTGRWTGIGVQPQNFKRDSDNMEVKRVAVMTGDLAHVASLYPPLEAVGDIARAMICAAPGHRFLIGDFSGVESRVTAWVSGQKSKVDQWAKFDRTGDPKDEPYYINGRNCGLPEDTARGTGKIADLAFGYQGSVGAWRKLAPDDDNSTDAEIVRYRDAWRRAHPFTEGFWRGVNRKMVDAVSKPGTVIKYKRLSITCDGSFLRVTLPSGRALSYPFPRLDMDKYKHEAVTFKDNAAGKWIDCCYGRGCAYGGLWTENIVQAISRDLLAAAMQRVEAAGYKIALHVHDEIVAEAPDGFGSVEEFSRLITALPEWADGLPVAAKVRNGPRFSKSENKPAAAAVVNVVQAAEEALPWEGESVMKEKPAVAPADDSLDSKIDQMRALFCISAPSVVPDAVPAQFRNGHDHAHEEQAESAETETETDPERGPYVYRDARGEPHAKVVRTPNGKSRFTQQHWTGKAWQTGMADRKLPYRLPELLAAKSAEWVCITEGEKDAVNIAKLGLTATTNPNGAQGWKKANLVPWFASFTRIAIFEDNDEPGRERTKRIIGTLSVITPPPDVRVISFPELQEGGDVSDWLAQDRSRGRAELLARIEAVSSGGELNDWDAGELLGKGPKPPPRQWLYGWQLCRGFASSLVAPGDHGKTTMRLTQAVELASGRELLGHRIYQRCRVLVLCLEDDKDELWRRLLAICLHHGVDSAELRGWLFCANFNGAKIAEEIGGKRVLGKLEPMLRKAIERRKPDAVILDPFVKLHALDENDNPDMDFVCSQLVKLAHEYNIAIDSPAHTRKGALTAGDSDNRRGASAQRDAARLDYTLTVMSEVEAKQFGIELDLRKGYVRLDRAKANIVRAIKASWYHLVSVQLDNSTDQYPEGDAVQALETWTPPDVQDLDPDSGNRILDKIDAGMPDGNRYSGAASAKKRAAWPIVAAEMSDMTEAQAREIIKEWLRRGVLISREYDKPNEGHGSKKADGLFVDPAKRPSVMG